MVEYARNANTIRKVSTVTNANRNIIDHMGSIGMKRMCVNVSSIFLAGDLNLYKFLYKL